MLALAQLQNCGALIVFPLVLGRSIAAILRPGLLILLLYVVLVSCALVALLFGCRQRLVILAAYVVQDLRELLVLSRRSSDDAASIAEVRLLALLAHLVPSLTTNISIVKKLIIWIENGCSRRPARHKS